ncbi:helix-turn-helix transcriptional regulator [Bacillus cereus]|uniref:Helix-turn-helix transcriptional regulator n=1 Tax=Bacillus cereus TaxID=1396 RepID=A0AAW7NJV0_BACCE|nr:helix-turn-helix transcriptional regulator [Bacillus cereus]MDN4876004.1 helix-turn-helix transcriptional regulator [Bacillus cereus]CUB58367.1 HTH-type transcriptional regulator Xre [Bacillus subtilis]
MEFKDRLRQLRKERKLTQTELGQAIGVTAGSVSKFETGFKPPSRETVERAADFLEVPVDYLLGRSNSREFDADIDNKYHDLKSRLQQLPEEHQEIVLQNMLTIMESLEKLNTSPKK